MLLMSCSFRRLNRLPLSIFEDLQHISENHFGDAATLRASICMKLAKNQNRGKESSESVTTVGSFLKISCATLVQVLDPLLTYMECIELRSKICVHCAPSPRSAMELLQSWESCRIDVLPTGMNELDDCLKGGFRVGTVSELVGRSGVGKTQLAMQLCVVAAKCGVGTAYIDTEKKLSLERLREISDARRSLDSDKTDDGGVARLKGNAHTGEVEVTANSYWSQVCVLRNTTIYSPTSTKELLSLIRDLEEEILLRNDEANNSAEKLPVHLLVIDSIAAPTRRDFGADTAPKRVSMLIQIAQILKRLAGQLQLAIVVINQVGMDQQNGEVRAALGISWHHCLSTRILMEREVQSENGSEMQFDRCRRTATIVKSNVARNACVTYKICDKGLIGDTIC